MNAGCLHLYCARSGCLLEHLLCRNALAFMKRACVSCPLTEIWFTCLSQTRRRVTMAGTSSKDSATNTLPIGVHGTQLKGNVVSREHTWQASCPMRSRSLWTVCNVRFSPNRSEHWAFRASEISSWSFSFYISILKCTSKCLKGTLGVLHVYFCSHCKLWLLLFVTENTLVLRKRSYFFGVEIWWFFLRLSNFVPLISMTTPWYTMLARHKRIVSLYCVARSRQY